MLSLGHRVEDHLRRSAERDKQATKATNALPSTPRRPTDTQVGELQEARWLKGPGGEARGSEGLQGMQEGKFH